MEKSLYKYYCNKYKPELFYNWLCIEIPFCDGSQNIDNFMQEKQKEGYTIKENWLLKKFELIKKLELEKTN